MTEKIYIYALYSDNDGIRYVGKTNKQDILKRLRQHVLNSKNLKTHRDRWIQKIINEGNEVKIKEIEVVNEENWKGREIYWIKYYRENSKLTNHSDGGESGHGILYTMNYENLRDWVQKNLNIKSKNDWERLIKTINKPDYIPNDPREVYLKRGWISWGDFLGTGNKHDNDVNYLSYDNAKEYIKKNLSHIDRVEKWKIAAKNSEIPEFIPNRPERYYSFKNRGWISYGDFLGTGRIANFNKEFVNYKDAQKYIINLGIKSESEWIKYLKNNERPQNIPSNPNQAYKDTGWTTWGEFFQTDKISDNLKHENYLSYENAKKYIQENYNFIKSSIQWRNFRNTNSIPYFIPLNPELSYKNKGWIGWGDYLCTGNIMNKLKVFYNYEDAKKIVHNYKLKSNKEWRVFSKKEGKRLCLPSAPNKTYKNKGWINWYDFLGK